MRRDDRQGTRERRGADIAEQKLRDWIVDILAGGVIGAVCGVILAWNVAIILGVPAGYESGPGEVFAHSVIAGILWLAALISGPLLGVAVARRQRRKRHQSEKQRISTS